jgi:hypothetical protein
MAVNLANTVFVQQLMDAQRRMDREREEQRAADAQKNENFYRTQADIRDMMKMHQAQKEAEFTRAFQLAQEEGKLAGMEGKEIPEYVDPEVKRGATLGRRQWLAEMARMKAAQEQEQEEIRLRQQPQYDAMTLKEKLQLEGQDWRSDENALDRENRTSNARIMAAGQARTSDIKDTSEKRHIAKLTLDQLDRDEAKILQDAKGYEARLFDQYQKQLSSLDKASGDLMSGISKAEAEATKARMRKDVDSTIQAIRKQTQDRIVKIRQQKTNVGKTYGIPYEAQMDSNIMTSPVLNTEVEQLEEDFSLEDM